MRRLPGCLVIAFAVLALACRADAKVFYASSDGQAGYFGEARVDADADGFAPSLEDAIAAARGQAGPNTIRLLTTAPRTLTEFRARECSFRIEAAARSGSEGLTIEGVTQGEGRERRWLTQITGLPFEQIKLDDPCYRPSALVALLSERESDPLDYLGSYSNPTVLGSPDIDRKVFGVSAMRQGLRVHCFQLTGASHVSFVDLAFKDCWLPAIFARDSHDIALRRSFIQGSSIVLAATASRPSLAYNYFVEDNLWIQDTSGFGQPSGPCAGLPHAADCPGDIWRKAPWGTVHDTTHAHFNGALFGSTNIRGSVLFARNRILNAYNGIRMKADCPDGCTERINVDVDVLDNSFEHVRDNPVEPEGHAANWHVAGNRFLNVYSAISLDDVAGGPIFVYGNTSRFDDVPERDCVDGPEHADARAVDFKGNKLVDPDVGYDPLCRNHQGGNLFKLGAKKPNTRLADIFAFNNSWATKAPLFSGVTTGTIRHWNNAIELKGCGTTGNLLCRIYPAEDQGFYFPTPDGSSLFLNSFSFDPKMLDDEYDLTTRHVFDHDAINLGFPILLKRLKTKGNTLEEHGLETRKLFADPDKDDFSLLDPEAKTGGCRITVEPDGTIACEETDGQGPAIGARNADGTAYRSPFTCAMPTRRWSECR